MAEMLQRRKKENGVVTPGILKCDCGTVFTLQFDDIACPKCGQHYNLAGQRLKDPEDRDPYEYRPDGDY